MHEVLLTGFCWRNLLEHLAPWALLSGSLSVELARVQQ